MVPEFYLLMAVGNGNRIELAARIVATQNAGRIFPRDCGTGFYLGPRNLGIIAPAIATLGNEVVDAALAILVAGEPVLDRRVLDFGVFERNQLNDSRVQLVFVALRCGATFEIRNIRAFIGDDERPFELTGVLFVDAEIGRKLHRAANALRNIDKRTVREDSRIQRCIIVVRNGNHRSQILLHQFGMLADRFGNRAENHASLGEFFLEGRDDRNAVEHGINGHTARRIDIIGRIAVDFARLALLTHASKNFLLAQRNTKLFIGLQQFRIDFIERLRTGLVFGAA